MASKLKQNIILLAITIIFFLAFLEIGTRIIAHLSPKFACDAFSNPDDWFVCGLEFILPKTADEHNQSGIILDQKICDKWDAELGWVPNPNCNSVRSSVRYTTNSQGFRGIKEFKPEKNRTRTIIVGDSFTWGENNQDNETYPFYLDKLFNGSIDVINMGVHGYGPDQFYLYYMRNGSKYKPDIVIFGLFLPDIHRTAFKVRSFFKPRFIIENDKLKLDPSSTNIPDLKTALEMSSAIKKKPRLYSISYALGILNKASRLISSYKDEVNLTLKIVEEMNSKLKENNTRLIVLLIPEHDMVEKNNDDYYGAIPLLTRNLEKNNIEYINLQPIFKREFLLNNQSLYMGHLKPSGNLVIAKELMGHLNKNP